MRLATVFLAVCLLFLACGRRDAPAPVASGDLRYFDDTYEQSRARFRERARALLAAYPDARGDAFRIPSATDPDLTMDYCYVPARVSKGRLLVISTGLHGIEGLGGGAVLDLFLTEFLRVFDLRDTGFVIFHGINAYGMKYRRRYTEDNVDLNRNGSSDGRIYGTINRGYDALRELLEPSGVAGTGRLADARFALRLLVPYATMPRRVLAEAIAGGQYQWPQGLFYGGRRLAPQLAEVKRVLTEILPQYRCLVNMDLHTAYGRRGWQHILMYALDPARMATIQSVFAGHTIDWSTSDTVYAVHGNFSDFIHALAPEKPRLTLFFEYGTVDSQGLAGAVVTIKTLVLENQGRRFGYASTADEQRVRGLVEELFYPSSPEWRSAVISQSRRTFEQLAAGWDRITSEDFLR